MLMVTLGQVTPRSKGAMEQEMVHELFGHWYASYNKHIVYTSTQCCGHSSTFHTLLHDARLADTCTSFRGYLTLTSHLQCSSSAGHCTVVQYSAVQCSTVQHSAIQCCCSTLYRERSNPLSVRCNKSVRKV